MNKPTILIAFCSYFQKIPTEAPQLELKANYGLVEPVPFEFPPMSAHWTPEALAAFDLTKRPKDDSVWERGFSFLSQTFKKNVELVLRCLSTSAGLCICLHAQLGYCSASSSQL